MKVSFDIYPEAFSAFCEGTPVALAIIDPNWRTVTIELTEKEVQFESSENVGTFNTVRLLPK